jgi:hypothetical protein
MRINHCALHLHVSLSQCHVGRDSLAHALTHTLCRLLDALYASRLGIMPLLAYAATRIVLRAPSFEDCVCTFQLFGLRVSYHTSSPVAPPYTADGFHWLELDVLPILSSGLCFIR